MADGGDTLGSLPPPRVKFKEKMEDIREATIEGSQFEAQFPEERTPVVLPIKSPRPQTPKHPPTSDVANRPKTTLRRSLSEKMIQDNNPNTEDEENGLNLSRKSTHESMPRKNAYESPTLSRRSTQELLSRKQSQDQIGKKSQPDSATKAGTRSQVASRSGVSSHPNTARRHSGAGNTSARPFESQNGYYMDGNVSDRSEPTSRLSSQLSFNHTRTDSISRSNKFTSRQESISNLHTSHASEIVQKKGKVIENGW